jgi:hypothetical protein
MIYIKSKKRLRGAKYLYQKLSFEVNIVMINDFLIEPLGWKLNPNSDLNTSVDTCLNIEKKTSEVLEEYWNRVLESQRDCATTPFFLKQCVQKLNSLYTRKWTTKVYKFN